MEELLKMSTKLLICKFFLLGNDQEFKISVHRTLTAYGVLHV
jgi:hypothetical protein